MRALFVAIGVLGLAATASAGTTRKVPQDFDTIQQAVDAAVTGDTVLVAKGRYNESVTVNTAGIKIIGKGAVIDSTVGTSNDDGFDVYANSVTIQGFRFVNGYDGIYTQNNNLIVTKCSFVGQHGYGIYLSGSLSNLHVTGCSFLGTYYQGVYCNSTNDVVVTKSSFRQGYDGGITVYGNGCDVEGCSFYTNLFSECVYVSGTDAVVLKNKMANNYYYGIEIEGANADVEGNTVAWMWDDSGIYVSGSGSTINGNKVSHSYQGIESYGNGNIVTGNSVQGVWYYGMEVGGDGVTVSGNTLQQSNDDQGLYVYSNTTAGGGTIADNKVTDCAYGGFTTDCLYNVDVSNLTVLNCGAGSYYYGIYLCGDGNTFTNCSVTGCSNIGFYISGNNNTFTTCKAVNNTEFNWVIFSSGNTLNSCTGTGSNGAGLMNGGSNTDINGGVFTGNRQDICIYPFGPSSFTDALGGVLFVTGGTAVNSDNWTADD